MINDEILGAAKFILTLFQFILLGKPIVLCITFAHTKSSMRIINYVDDHVTCVELESRSQGC